MTFDDGHGHGHGAIAVGGGRPPSEAAQLSSSLSPHNVPTDFPMAQDNNIRLSSLIAPSFRDLHKLLKSSTPPEEVWCKGGRGSTKSSFFGLEIMLGLTKDPIAHAFISRRYDNELRDSVYGQIMWAANKLGVSQYWRFITAPMSATHIHTGQKILFRGVDNPLKAKSIQLGKGYIKYLWAEEVDQYGGMEELRSIIQSVFRGEGASRIAMFSYNPPKSSRAWVNQEVRIEKPGRVVHSSDYRSVPREWLGERFLAEAAHLQLVNPTAYDHEYLGIEVGTGLEVFNNVETRRITTEEKSSFGDLRQGLDFGYAIDPLAFERMYYDSRTRTLWIFEEISGIGLSNRAFAERASLDHRRVMIGADKASPKDIDELRNEYGFKIRGVDKPSGSIEHGVNWLAALERIIIDPVACPLAAREFVNYTLERTRSGEVISRYPDRNNHSIDAVRYGLYEEIASKPRRKVPCDGLAIPVLNWWGTRKT
jgi:phage terminase large subunit